MSGTAVMNNVIEDFSNKISLQDDDASPESVAEDPNSTCTTPTSSASNAGIPRPGPTRRLSRNKSSSGSMQRTRAPPGRSKSHKIGRPTFDPKAPSTEPVRGVNRSKSGRTKGAPNRAGSFNRRVPDRSSSASSSLRARRLAQQQPAAEVSDDVSVTDSVFTSASIQTLDSIAVRKKQIDHDVPVVTGMRGQRPRRDGPAIEFDESLHTVDSMHLNHKHISDEYYDDDCDDLSVFSESFGSTESCEVLSDFEEDEMDGAIAEDEDEAIMKIEDEE